MGASYEDFIDAAKGLAFLHKANIVHQDIKSSNILLFGLQDIKAKIHVNIGSQSPDGATHHNSTQILGTFIIVHQSNEQKLMTLLFKMTKK